MIRYLKNAIFYITIFLLCFALALTAQNYDPDLWARLIVGMAVIQTGNVLKEDFLSYTPTIPWFDHEWGSSVIFYLTQHFLGHNGLLALQIALMFFTIFFIIKAVEVRAKENYNPHNIFVYFIAISVIFTTYATIIRCQMFTFMLFALMIYLLELARKGHNKVFFIIPFIVIIWNNLHGGVVSGLGILFLYTLGEFLNKKPFKNYLITLIVSSLVLLINPYGSSYLVFLLSATTMSRVDVSEWWSIFHKIQLFKNLDFKVYTVFILIAELIKTIKGKFNFQSLDKTKFLVIGITLISAIKHVKLIPLCGIAITVYTYNDICSIFSRIKFSKILKTLIYVLLLSYSFLMICGYKFKPILNNKMYPLAEIEFIKLNNIKGNILVNFGLGSYTAYKLYPQNLIYMDGRYEEVYPNGRVELLNKFFTVKTGWDEILIKYPPDVILAENYYDIYKVLPNTEKWVLVFDGMNFGVFVKKENLKKSYKMPPFKLDFYRETLFDTNIKFKK